MRGKPELKAKCIRLRVEKRLSLREIHQRTGASKGSLSSWLRPYPLTDDEKRAKRKEGQRGGPPSKDRGVESTLHQMRGPGLTRRQKAQIAESAALLRLVVQGFRVFGSPFDGDRVDWLVVIPSTRRIFAIQVKYASESSRKSQLPYVRLWRTEGHNRMRRYKKGDFDFIVGYDLFTDTCYVWSWDEVEHLKSAVTICPEAAERWDKMRA